MEFRKEMLLLYAVTDRGGLGRQAFHRQIEEALRGGVTMLQLREKALSKDEYVALAREVKAICRRYDVPLIVNDRVDVALESGADGVHVGIEDTPVEQIRACVPPGFLIGATCKTLAQARQAERAGADYMGVGAVFPSPTKKNAVRITVETLRAICGSVSIPAVAIGGIGLENVEALRGGGMAGIAAVSAIFGAENITQAAATLKERVKALVGPENKGGSTMKTALSIAGSDSSGGAGIQADLKAMTMNGVYAMSVITAMTAQNTSGVRSIQEATPAFLREQIDAVFEDIVPDAVKIGMVSSAELIRVIAERLRHYGARHIVVDPVMVATSGSRLMKTEAVSVLTEALFPLAEAVTPNIPEAQVLAGMTISGREEMQEAAKRIGDAYDCAVLLKGGHSVNDASDLLYADGKFRWFVGRRIENPNTHGTGCTLSSAIAANLAKGFSLDAAVERAKDYLSGALAAGLDLGKGAGPMMHNFALPGRLLAEADGK